DLALVAARNQLSGHFSKEVDAIKARLVTLLSRVEAELDFPDEEDVTIAPPSETAAGLKEVERGVARLIATYEEGKIITEGVRVVILGRPNVGKSTLLNLLLREERAIVTPIPGTTRDIIEEVVNIRGLPVRLMDTAGLRDGADTVEEIGLRFARERLEGAHLVLYVTDASTYSEEDHHHLTTINGKKVIVVINKIDLTESKEIERASAIFSDWRVVPISALQERGVDALEEAVFEEATGHSPRFEGGGDETVVTSVRHKVALESACEAVKRASDNLSQCLSGEFLALELRDALGKIGEITGEVTNDAILDSIFSHFCIGK
ncbi:MAG: tRNA modification GTPase, partial [Thermodesulfobacteriota bacterium]